MACFEPENRPCGQFLWLGIKKAGSEKLPVLY